MKTQQNKLSFKSQTMIELNDQQLLEVDGGSTPACAAATAAAAGALVGAGIAWLLR